MLLITPVLLLAGFTIGSSDALSPRDNTTLVSHVAAINSAVVDLTKLLNDYTGGIEAAGPSTLGILAIHSANRIGYAAANASPQLSAAESHHLVAYTKRSVGVTIPIAINVTEAKKPLFVHADLRSLVVASLKLLLRDHDSFSVAVGKKLDPSAVPKGSIVAEKIAQAVQGGIDYYTA